MTRNAQLRMGGTLAVALLMAMIVAASAWRWSTAETKVADVARQTADAATPPPKPSFYDPADPYDKVAIEENPRAYYSQSVPSRVWQMAPIPEGQERHEPIEIIGEGYRFVEENQELDPPLLVRAKPGRPVTFTALDTGRFANGEISITVKADEEGLAQADFWVGDAGGFRVLVGSPENSGPAEFVIQALTAKELRDLASGKYASDYWKTFNQSPQAEKLLSDGPGQTRPAEQINRQETQPARPIQ